MIHGSKIVQRLWSSAKCVQFMSDSAVTVLYAWNSSGWKIFQFSTSELCWCLISNKGVLLLLKFVVLFNLVNAWRDFAHPHERAVKPLRDSLIFWFLLGEKKLQNRLIIFKCYSVLTAICLTPLKVDLKNWAKLKQKTMTVCSLLTLDLQKETRKTVQIVQILGPPQKLKEKNI